MPRNNSGNVGNTGTPTRPPRSQATSGRSDTSASENSNVAPFTPEQLEYIRQNPAMFGHTAVASPGPLPSVAVKTPKPLTLHATEQIQSSFLAELTVYESQAGLRGMQQRELFFAPELWSHMTSTLKHNSELRRVVGECDSLLELPTKSFLRVIKFVLSPTLATGLPVPLGTWAYNINVIDQNGIINHETRVRSYFNSHGYQSYADWDAEVSEETRAQLIQAFIAHNRTIPSHSSHAQAFYLSLSFLQPTPRTWSAVEAHVHETYFKCANVTAQAIQLGITRAPKSGSSNAKVGKICYGCGNAEHYKDTCPFRTHPDFNLERCPFIKSNIGRLYKAVNRSSIKRNLRYSKSGRCLIHITTTDSQRSGRSNNQNSNKNYERKDYSPVSDRSEYSEKERTNSPKDRDRERSQSPLRRSDRKRPPSPYVPDDTSSQSSVGSAKSNLQRGKRKVEHISSSSTSYCLNINNVYSYSNDAFRINMEIPNVGITSKCILDTGSDANIIRRSIIDKNISHFNIYNKSVHVVGVLQNEPTQSNFTFCEVDCVMLRFLSKHLRINNVEFLVLDDNMLHDSIDVLLGKHVIIQNNLLDVFRESFVPPDQWKRSHISDLLTHDTDSFEDYQEELLDQHGDECLILKNDLHNFLDRIKISNDFSQRQRILSLLDEFKDIFHSGVHEVSAAVPAFNFQVDVEGWSSHCKRNRGMRKYNIHKVNAINKFVSEFLEMGIIEQVETPNYSHVHLTVKSNGDYRFCIDFRGVNLYSENKSFPLVNIMHTINNIGNKKCKYFAVLDLSAGFYQVELAEECRPYTAFLTPNGLYQWKRVPMGLKGAPSHFQRVMMETVLKGLIQVIVDVYIDDIIIYAASEEEFLKNLAIVFERFRHFNIKLNPDKCRLGFTSVEYCGHLLDASGITFTKKKKDKVLDIPLPTTVKQLRSFLGLCNFFRRHVPKYHDDAAQLHAMIDAGASNRRLKWSHSTQRAFNQLKVNVANAHKLYFYDVDAESEIILQTDASDYGIGAYLFQRIGGVDYPIDYLSKSLTKSQRRWSTIEKECFSIYTAFKVFEHLLRDNKFTLYTDHLNLLYLNVPVSQKVMRWKLLIQHFDCKIQYLEGVRNVVADAFSRLCHPCPSTSTSIQPLKSILKSSPRFNGKSTTIKQKSVVRFSYVALDDAHDIFFEDNIIKFCNVNVGYKLSDDIHQLITTAHNSVIGHHGVHATLQKLVRSGRKWPQMRADVQVFIAQCAACAKMSMIRRQIHMPRYTVTASSPMLEIAIDTLGPFPEDDSGNIYIFVIVDSFTRWTELIPSRDKTAASAARAILQFFGRFGCPGMLRSDNGTEYVNQVIGALCEYLLIKHNLIAPGNHQENSIVERKNREIINHLVKLVVDRHVKHAWSSYLPIIQRIINTTVHQVLKVTPAELLFANAINYDRFILTEPLHNEQPQLLTMWIDNYIEEYTKIVEEAQLHQLQYNIKKNNDNNHNKDEFLFPLNSLVYIKYPTGPTGKADKPTKLHPVNHGPYRVTARLNSHEYNVKNVINNKSIRVAKYNMIPCHAELSHEQIKELLISDQLLDPIIRVLQHKQTGLHDAHIKYIDLLIEFEDKSQQWLPLAKVAHDKIVKEYIKQHNLKNNSI